MTLPCFLWWKIIKARTFFIIRFEGINHSKSVSLEKWHTKKYILLLCMHDKWGYDELRWAHASVNHFVGKFFIRNRLVWWRRCSIIKSQKVQSDDIIASKFGQVAKYTAYSFKRVKIVFILGQINFDKLSRGIACTI